jgi:protein TonB
MTMQTFSYPNSQVQKPVRSIATIALVGSLHLILIYAVLVAIDVVPAPTIPTITTATVIPNKTVHPTPPPPINPTMMKPTTTEVPVPRIPMDPGTPGTTITAVPEGGGGSVSTPSEVFTAAAPIAATHTIPSYPAVDRRLDHEGVVLLTVMIDAEGNVSDANVLKSSGYDSLDAAAVSWVKEHWRYKPATHNGNAVAATARAEVTFRLTRD